MKKVSSIIILCLLSIAFQLNANPVSADGIPFGISPENPMISYFDFTINPGESVEDAITIKNFSDQKIFVRVKAVDAKTGTDGGLSYDFENNTGHSRWVSLDEEDNIMLYPSNLKRLKFKVTVPPDTPPGEYVVGFLSSLTPTTPTPAKLEGNTSGYTVNIITRVAITMVIRVPGPEKCELKMTSSEASVFSAKWRYTLILHNTGNVLFSGTQKLTVRDASTGEIVEENTTEIGHIVPETDMLSYVSFDIPDYGSYDYTVEYQHKKKADCKYTYSGTTAFAEPEKNLLSTQSTVIAEFERILTITPSLTSTPGVIEEVKTPGTATWYIWISAVIFLISLGLVIYALSILKRSKK